MLSFSSEEHAHRRYNPLIDEWVLVSPHRAKRPWHGKEEIAQKSIIPSYDKECALCPTNLRASGETNPDYKSTFVFVNDFSALTSDTPQYFKDDPFIKIQSARGVAKVVCFSPFHNKTIPELSKNDIKSIIDVWATESRDLGKNYLWVQIFENKGELMGCSQPHPHGQIWASDFLPNIITKKDLNLEKYFSTYKTNLLLDYVSFELKAKKRIVVENDSWLVVVPFWAVWPFETMLLPKTHVRRLDELTEAQRLDLAEVMQEFTILYDNLFKCSFPYSMGWHYAPFFKDERNIEHWQLHGVYYPPLLRSRSVRKFMVGYEMLAESQRDLTPEGAAEKLRTLPKVHYKNL